MKVSFPIYPETTPVGEFEGRKVREFTDPFYFCVDDHKIIIPKGFQTDCSSVPRWPLFWLLFGDEGEIASYAHDYLYRIDSEPEVTKDMADEVFLKMMEFTNDPEEWWKQKVLYSAVCLFGSGSYHEKKVSHKFIKKGN